MTYIAATVVAHCLDGVVTKYDGVDHMDNVDTRSRRTSSRQVRVRLMVGGGWGGPPLGGAGVRPHLSWFIIVGERGIGTLFSWS